MRKDTAYRGMTVSEDTHSRMVCRFHIHELRRAALDLETAKGYIDAALSAKANRPAGPRIVACETRCHGMQTAGKRRQAQDRADAMRGDGGRFQAGTL